ncbi:MAG: gamma-glutamyltransferase family protein [Gaiellaceae bacterium]
MRQDFERLFKPDSSPPAGFPRMPAITGEAMVATSHPLATRAGVRALEQGGNAMDAALAAAAVLPVVEPNLNGLGGDCFAIVCRGGDTVGLNGSGRSPAVIDGGRVDRFGPRSVTVPGAVAAWFDLATRYGRFSLDQALARAAELAERGVAATARVATLWQRAEAAGRAPFPAPRIGSRYRLPELAATLRRIATDGPDAFYRGEVARAIAAVTWLSEEDLAAHRSEWVEPLRLPFGGVEVCEPPPNTQGAAALAALALAGTELPEGAVERLDSRIRAVRAGLAAAYAHIGDEPLPKGFFDVDRLRAGPQELRGDDAGDTTYLCAVDGDRMAVSLIQSTYEGFGSGLAAPGTGVALQNRAAGFVETEGHPDRLGPSRRPFHTIIPGMLLHEGRASPFGVMGGAMQAQGHLQVVDAVVSLGLDPQAALDRGRFRVRADGSVALEPGLWEHAEELESRGHAVARADTPRNFGVGQMILLVGDVLVGGSDGRGDGHAAGL